jgi:hypothetical protein
MLSLNSIRFLAKCLPQEVRCHILRYRPLSPYLNSLSDPFLQAYENKDFATKLKTSIKLIQTFGLALIFRKLLGETI